MIKFNFYIVLLVPMFFVTACDGTAMPSKRSKALVNYDQQIKEFFKDNKIILAEEMHTSVRSYLFYDIQESNLKENHLITIRDNMKRSGWILKMQNDVSELYCNPAHQKLEITKPYSGSDKQSFIGGPFADKWIITLATQTNGFDECKE